MTRLSVCMPVYNGAAWLPEQLDSILVQLGPSDELVINDDGSSDDTFQILKAYQQRDKRIQLLPAKRFGSVVYNLEYILTAAKGEYILLSDQDDVWLPEKVNHMLAALAEHALVVHDCLVVDCNKQTIHPSFFEAHGSGVGRLKNFIRNGYLGCCMGFRRNLLHTALPFPKNLAMHDIWLGNVAAWWYDVHFISDKLIYYRRHGNNASSASETSNNSRLRQLKLRIKLAVQLFKRLLR